jgi:hypothetical protein
MARSRTGSTEDGGPPMVTLTRRCTNCERDREVENIADPETFPCRSCGAISVWLCHVCGRRTPGTIRMQDGRLACGSCRQAVMHGPRA